MTKLAKFDSLYPWTELEIADTLATVNWLKHPNFAWNYGQEGYENFRFGSKLGPTNDPWLIVHDAAHVVEFTLAGQTDRFTKGNFEFKYAMVEAFGNEYEEPQTRQMTQRELRTCAIQWHLTKGTALEKPIAQFIFENAHTLRLQTDWWAWGRGPARQLRNRAEYLHRCIRRYADVDLVAAWQAGLNKLPASITH